MVAAAVCLAVEVPECLAAAVAVAVEWVVAAEDRKITELEINQP